MVAMDSQSATMSSLEIAGRTCKQHKNVIVDIENVLRQAGIEGAKFSAPFKMPSGQTAKVYNLPRLECDLVISGYSVPYRMAIIKRWHELELKQLEQPQFRLPQTYAEALKELGETVEELDSLRIRVEKEAPLG